MVAIVDSEAKLMDKTDRLVVETEVNVLVDEEVSDSDVDEDMENERRGTVRVPEVVVEFDWEVD